MNNLDFWKWSEAAKPGDSIVYHRGFLAFDRADYCGRDNKKDRCRCGQCWRAKESGENAYLAWSQYERGHAVLTQRKMGAGDYEYILKRVAR